MTLRYISLRPTEPPFFFFHFSFLLVSLIFIFSPRLSFPSFHKIYIILLSTNDHARLRDEVDATILSLSLSLTSTDYSFLFTLLFSPVQSYVMTIDPGSMTLSSTYLLLLVAYPESHGDYLRIWRFVSISRVTPRSIREITRQPSKIYYGWINARVIDNKSA